MRNPEAPRVLRAAQVEDLRRAQEKLTLARAEALLQAARVEAAAVRERVAEEAKAAAVGQLIAAERRAREMLEEARGDLTALAVRIAEKLLGEDLRIRPEGVASIVESCLRSCRESRRIVARVNPADLPLVEAALPRLRGTLEHDVLTVRGDEEVQRGGCIVDTELGQIDGRLDTQLRAIREALGR
jgi:flagellar biosynthesis/type III secretory pathway protein FliH